MLAAKNATLAFADGVGLHQATIEASKGSVTVIMGPSGSGKTTLLRVLSLLDFPQQGVVSLDGLEYRFPEDAGSAPRFPHPRVTMVFQQLFLWPHLTNRANLEFALASPAQYSAMEKLVDVLQLSPFLGKFPNESSLGQRQRVAIARSLALLPEYALLDEVTSSLDRALRNRVAQVIHEAKVKGAGFLVVTHDRRFAEQIGDRLYWMEDGKLSEDEPR